MLRIQQGARQSDVAVRASVSATKVARIERGDVSRMPVGDVVRVANSLGAVVELYLRWRGEALDRLLDSVHAALVEAIVGLLRQSGWQTAVEVSFNVDGERGVIDALAFHSPTGAVLVVEVKSVVPDAQAMLAGLDRKARVGRAVARERGWAPTHVGRLLVIGDGSTARRRINLLGETFRTSYPARGSVVRAWLRAPSGPVSGLLFLPYRHGVTASRSPATHQRVRRRRYPGNPSQTATA